MKIVISERVILSHEEVATLSHARDILEKMAVNSGDANVCGLACAITDCLEVLSGCYEEEDF